MSKLSLEKRLKKLFFGHGIYGWVLFFIVIGAILLCYVAYMDFNAGLMIVVATANFSTLAGYGFSNAYSFYICMGIQYNFMTTIGAWFHGFPTQGDWFDWAWQSGIASYAGIVIIVV